MALPEPIVVELSAVSDPLFRLRFGLHAVLARLQAEVDWAGLETQWAREA